MQFSKEEKDKIHGYFGAYPEHLTIEEFELKQKELKKKYHPDTVAKYNDPLITEMAEEKFREIQKLSEKLKSFLSGEKPVNEIELAEFGKEARFQYNNLKIEILTTNKDLKYLLFGTQYRWLERGDKFRIKNTNTSITIEESHRGNTIGFKESIKMYLTFNPDDSIEAIAAWMFEYLKDNASSLIVDNKMIPIDEHELIMAIKRKSVIKIENKNG